MEIWARCPECVRWFYCGRADNGGAPVSGCPVCGTEAHETVISDGRSQRNAS